MCTLAFLAACSDEPTATDPPATTPAPTEETPASEAPVDPPAPATATAEAESFEERAPVVQAETQRRFRRELRQARIANRAGNREEAIVHYRQAVDADASGRALCELGWVQFQSEQLDAAEESLRRALALLPSPAAVPTELAGPLGACLYNIGRVHEARSDVSLARTSYERSLEVRPGNRIVQARLDGLGQSPSAPTEATGRRCDAGQSAQPDFDAIIAEISSLRGEPEAFNPLLLRLGMHAGIDHGLFIDDGGFPLADEDLEAEATVRRVPLRQGSNAATAFHVTVSSGGNYADRVVVWARAGEGHCIAGAFSLNTDSCSTSCLGDGPTMAISAIALVAEDREALQVDTTGGACSGGSERGATAQTSFYGIEGNVLVKYVEVDTYDAWYTSPIPPTSEDSTTFTFSETFPRVLTLTAQTECQGGCNEAEFAQRRREIEDESDEDLAYDLQDELYSDCGSYPTECTASEETSALRYVNGTYVEVTP